LLFQLVLVWLVMLLSLVVLVGLMVLGLLVLVWLMVVLPAPDCPWRSLPRLSAAVVATFRRLRRLSHHAFAATPSSSPLSCSMQHPPS
jgi:hypothetical protein